MSSSNSTLKKQMQTISQKISSMSAQAAQGLSYNSTNSTHGHGSGIMAQTMPNSLTIPGGALGTIDLRGLTLDTVSLNYKKYEVIESTQDLLVLSCVWYRLRQERTINQAIGINPSRLLDNVLYDNVNQVDVDFANQIRDYYSKKIMMLKLKSINLTKYREDLNKFIHSDGLKFEENICGLVYRLPEFYKYDVKFDDMIRDCKREVETKIGSTKMKLTHIGTFNVNRKSMKRVEYWFKNENDELANIWIEPSNPLLKVWDKVITNDNTLEVNCYKKMRDDISYYKISNFSLV